GASVPPPVTKTPKFKLAVAAAVGTYDARPAVAATAGRDTRCHSGRSKRPRGASTARHLALEADRTTKQREAPGAPGRGRTYPSGLQQAITRGWAVGVDVDRCRVDRLA